MLPVSLLPMSAVYIIEDAGHGKATQACYFCLLNFGLDLDTHQFFMNRFTEVSDQQHTVESLILQEVPKVPVRTLQDFSELRIIIVESACNGEL